MEAIGLGAADRHRELDPHRMAKRIGHGDPRHRIPGVVQLQPRPGRPVTDFLLASACALFCYVVLLPQADGFVMLCCAQVLFLRVGSYMLTRPALASIGGGFTIIFVDAMGIRATQVFDWAGIPNDVLADLSCVSLALVSLSIFVPVAGRWMRRRMLRCLRGYVIEACLAPLRGQRARLETAPRDLLQKLLARHGATVAACSICASRCSWRHCRHYFASRCSTRCCHDWPSCSNTRGQSRTNRQWPHSTKPGALLRWTPRQIGGRYWSNCTCCARNCVMRHTRWAANSCRPGERACRQMLKARPTSAIVSPRFGSCMLALEMWRNWKLQCRPCQPSVLTNS